jgi:hypothetical protein
MLKIFRDENSIQTTHEMMTVKMGVRQAREVEVVQEQGLCIAWA